jgi:signal peptidase I
MQPNHSSNTNSGFITFSDIKETIIFVITCLAIALPIRFFVFQPVIVQGESMSPNFHTHDYLIVDELSFRFRDIKRYEVLVFKSPMDPKLHLIKRVIGLPGERLTSTDGIITIFDSKNNTSFIARDEFVSKVTPDTFDITLGKDQYWVLGDNRPNSADSRYWNALDKKFVTGRALLRLFPFNNIDLIPGKIETYPLGKNEE